MAKKLTAAAYVRVSTDRQEASPDQQRSEIVEYADREGYQITRWYEDIGISGDRTDKRLDFQRMIADGSCGEFDAILCWDQDRFGRFDMLEAGKWIHPLREAGVHLATVTEGRCDWSDMAGRLLYSMKQEGKHQFLHDLSRNVTRTLRQKAQAGQWLAGNPPYGYTVGDDHRLYPGPPEAVETVRELFARYAAGASLRELTDWLDARGIRSARGGRWSVESLAKLLRNEHYLGRSTYGRSSSSKYQRSNPTGKRRKFDRDDWIVVPDTHEALVDQETFDTVQERLKSNRRNTGPKARNGTFALKGLVKCGACGSPMHGHVQRGVRKYLCYRYLQSAESCQRYVVNEREVLRQVLAVLREQVFEWLFTEEALDRLRLRMREILQRPQQGTALVEGHLAKVQGQLEQARRRLCEVPADMIPHVSGRIRELETHEAKLADQLAGARQPVERQVDVVTKRVEAAMEWLPRIEALVDTDYDPATVRKMLAEFVTEIRCNVRRQRISETGWKHWSILEGGKVHFKLAGFPPELFQASLADSSTHEARS